MLPRRLLLNLCALLLGVVLASAFLEIALRFYNPIIQTVKGDQVVLRVNYSVVLQNKDIPGISSEIHIHANSVGFRGEDPPSDLAERLSVVAVGGSTTYSIYQSEDRTWTALLGNALASCFDRVWINNAGFDGHSSFAHIQLIRRYIAQLHPKVVIMLIGANDAYARQPLKDAAGLTAFDREQIVGPLSLDAGVKGFLKGLSNRSEVISLSVTLYRGFRTWMLGLGYRNLDWPHLPEGDAMPSDGEQLLASNLEQQDAYTDRLRTLIRLLRNGDTVPILMTQPTVFGPAIDPSTGKDLSRIEHGLLEYRLFDIYNETMRNVAESDGAYLIDLARLMPKDTRYFIDHVHYTDEGAKKVSEIVATELLPYLSRRFDASPLTQCRSASGSRPVDSPFR